MSILLAIGDQNFTEILRSSFVKADLDVIDKDVYHRNYLNEIIELEKPSMVILHDVYLPSDFTDAKENEEEMLQLISYWRTIYDNKLRVVYLCERDRTDPFLGNLVARNVLDIFNERHISTPLFIEQLSQEARFANVAKFGIGHIEVEYEEEPVSEVETVEEEKPAVETRVNGEAIKQQADRAKQLITKISEKAKNVVEAGNEWNQQRQAESVLKRTSNNKAEPPLNTNQLDFEEYLDLMPVPKEVYARSQVIGTVVIAVAGVKPHLGSTHTAMSIASFLQKRRHSVALIELNYSEDFDRIHALYEGERQFIRHQSVFSYQGIDHYKFREDIRLGEIMATYEYVVLDIGAIEDSPYHDEYIRSHVRIMLTSPYEWKQHWTDQFCKSVNDEGHFIFVVPFAEKANVKDMEERLPHLEIVAYPSASNPYAIEEEGDAAIQSMLQGYIKENSQGFSKKTVVVASVVSAIVTTGVISAFMLL